MDDIEIEETRRCPVCSSSRLSRQVRYHGPEHHLTFANLGSKGVLGGKRDLMVGPSRARVCLQCGYVLVFLERTDLESVVAALR